MPRQENLDAIHRAALRFKARDLDGFLELYSNSVMHHGFSNRIRPGVPGLRDHYNYLLQAFPDMRIEVDDVIAEGEKVVRRFAFYGTHRGEYLGAPATGKVVHAPGIQVLWFERGKCVEIWQVTDSFSFLSQIGAVPKLREAR